MPALPDPPHAGPPPSYDIAKKLVVPDRPDYPLKSLPEKGSNMAPTYHEEFKWINGERRNPPRYPTQDYVPRRPMSTPPVAEGRSLESFNEQPESFTYPEIGFSVHGDDLDDRPVIYYALEQLETNFRSYDYQVTDGLDRDGLPIPWNLPRRARSLPPCGELERIPQQDLRAPHAGWPSIRYRRRNNERNPRRDRSQALAAGSAGWDEGAVGKQYMAQEGTRWPIRTETPRWVLCDRVTRLMDWVDEARLMDCDPEYTPPPSPSLSLFNEPPHGEEQPPGEYAYDATFYAEQHAAAIQSGEISPPPPAPSPGITAAKRPRSPHNGGDDDEAPPLKRRLAGTPYPKTAHAAPRTAPWNATPRPPTQRGGATPSLAPRSSRAPLLVPGQWNPERSEVHSPNPRNEPEHTPSPSERKARHLRPLPSCLSNEILRRLFADQATPLHKPAPPALLAAPPPVKRTHAQLPDVFDEDIRGTAPTRAPPTPYGQVLTREAGRTADPRKRTGPATNAPALGAARAEREMNVVQCPANKLRILPERMALPGSPTKIATGTSDGSKRAEKVPAPASVTILAHVPPAASSATAIPIATNERTLRNHLEMGGRAAGLPLPGPPGARPQTAERGTRPPPARHDTNARPHVPKSEVDVRSQRVMPTYGPRRDHDRDPQRALATARPCPTFGTPGTQCLPFRFAPPPAAGHEVESLPPTPTPAPRAHAEAGSAGTRAAPPKITEAPVTAAQDNRMDVDPQPAQPRVRAIHKFLPLTIRRNEAGVLVKAERPDFSNTAMMATAAAANAEPAPEPTVHLREGGTLEYVIKPEGGFPARHRYDAFAPLINLEVSTNLKWIEFPEETTILVDVLEVCEPAPEAAAWWTAKVRETLEGVLGTKVPEIYPPKHDPNAEYPDEYEFKDKTATAWLVTGLTSENKNFLIGMECIITDVLTLFCYPLDLVVPKFVGTATGFTAPDDQAKDNIREGIKDVFKGGLIRDLLEEVATRAREQAEPGTRFDAPSEALVEETINSLEVEILTIPDTGRVFANTYCTPATNIPLDWRRVCQALLKVRVPVRQNQTGHFKTPVVCGVCYGADHNMNQCKFPAIRGWKGPVPNNHFSRTRPPTTREDELGEPELDAGPGRGYYPPQPPYEWARNAPRGGARSSARGYPRDRADREATTDSTVLPWIHPPTGLTMQAGPSSRAASARTYAPYQPHHEGGGRLTTGRGRGRAHPNLHPHMQLPAQAPPRGPRGGHPPPSRPNDRGTGYSNERGRAYDDDWYRERNRY